MRVWRVGTEEEVSMVGSAWILAGERWLSNEDSEIQSTADGEMLQIECLVGDTLYE